MKRKRGGLGCTVDVAQHCLKLGRDMEGYQSWPGEAAETEAEEFVRV